MKTKKIVPRGESVRPKFVSVDSSLKWEAARLAYVTAADSGFPRPEAPTTEVGMGARRCRPIIFPQIFSENFMKVRKIKKVSMVLLFKIETCNEMTCNENWTQLSLGQSSSWTSCQPSWMAAITKYCKNGYHGCSTIQDRDLQCKPNRTRFCINPST